MHEGHRQRLRETYIENGLNGFHDHQVLELILTYSIPRVDTNPTAHLLLERYGSLEAVFNAPVKDLMKVKGVGEKTAVMLTLFGAASRKAARSKNKSAKINTPNDAMRYCTTLIEDQKAEAMFVISMDKLRYVLHVDMISKGTPTETAAYPRLIVEYAIRHGASSVIIVHNHPSGDLTPSPNDLDMTEKVLKALSSIGITLHDHIIVSGESAYSMVFARKMHSGETEQELTMAAEKEK